MIPRSRIAACLVGLVLVVSCGDGATEPPPEPPPDLPRPTMVIVSPATVELNALGATVQLTARVSDQDGREVTGAAVTWQSAAPAVATVSGSGLVTAVGGGMAAVTATAGGASGTAEVTVAQVASSVAVSPALDTLVVGDTVRLAAEVSDANGHAVAGAEFTWASADTSVATVDATGLATGVGAGEAEVTATAFGITGRAVLAVVNPAPSAIAVTPDTVELTALGQTAQLTALVRDQIGRVMGGVRVSWSSADTTVAAVDSAGLVTAVGSGAATVTASAGEASGGARVTVMQSAGSVVVSPAADTIALGDTLRLAAKAFDANGNAIAGAEFEWLSSDAAVASVDASGLVRGVGEGRATITAASGDARGTAGITIQNPDRAVLVALYNATDGPNWVNSDNWLTDAPLGEWFGVRTDGSGRVVSLDLAGRWDNDAREQVSHGLSGPIPPELGGLANLTALSLGGNALPGPIPPELGGLANLTWLSLGGNALSGPIPPELGRLAHLTELSLGANALSGPIPPELGRLSNLAWLDLRANDLSGPIPPELGRLANLTGLDLSHNQLTELSAGVFVGLTNLTSLDLRSNPGSPFRLTIQPVRVDDENLLAPGPAEVAVRVPEGAPFPIRVPLSVRGGDVSADTFTIGTGSAQSSPATLTRNAAGGAGAQLTAGPAPTVPESIRGVEVAVADPIVVLPALSPTVAFTSAAASAPEGGTVVLELRLSTPAGTPSTFSYTLDIDDDPSTADADAFDHDHGASGSVQIAAGAGSAEIEVAINDDNDIEPAREVFTVTLDAPGEASGYARGFPHAVTVTIEEGVCDRTPRIRDEIMGVIGTEECAGTDDEDLASILELDIRGDAPWERSERGVEWTRELVARILGGECAVESRPAGSDARGGSVTCPGGGEPPAPPDMRNRAGRTGYGGTATKLREGDFAGLSNLEALNLRRLGLTELPPGVFAGLTKLNWLSLQWNELTSLPAGIFSDLTSFWQGLILANNRLTSLPETIFTGLFPDPETSGLPSRGLLILEYNELREVPPRVFEDLPGVDWLFLNGNRLTELPPGVFSDLSGMTYLNLEANQLDTIRTGTFAGLSVLPALSISSNRLTAVPTAAFGDVAGLQRLYLADNRISDLTPRGFSSLSGLTLLDLSRNPLGNLEASDFSGLPDLDELRLSDVGLAELPRGLFSEVGGIEVLHLRDNRLNELSAGAFLGLGGLAELRLRGNPGAPFALTLKPRRTDTGDPLSPGPATVAVELEQGAPLNITVPLSVHGADVSASEIVLAAGTDLSSEVTVTRHGGAQSATQVVAGPAPALSSAVEGIELRVADPLVLFGAATNRAPVAERVAPWLRLRVGGDPGVIDVSSYFRDPDGDNLTYAGTSDDPDVVSAAASDGRVTVVPLRPGSATVRVTATDPEGLSAQSSIPVGVRGASPGTYDIDLILIDEVSESVQAAFDDAVDYWSSILAGTELSDVPIRENVELGCWDITTEQALPTVDDLVIVASVREIDGPSGILASAGFCGLRTGEGGLPFMGAMQFDVSDLEWLEENGDMREVILHEMGHVLGIGTIWRRFGLLVNPSLAVTGNPDTHFPGPLAVAAFDEAGGTAYTNGEKVPVENRAGPGSGDSHWREFVLDHELMTPYQNGGVPDPLSAITIQSLADLGYTVDVGLAEPYLLPGAAAVADPTRKIEYGDDILRGPIIVVDRDGRVRRVIPGDDR